MTNNETPSEKRLFALLIGIDEYLAERALSGCVNDVDAMRILLQNRYGVPDERIRVLTNTEATRDNILRAFEEHLINNPDIQRGDQILFHYCGHGSQMQAGPGDYEPDGMNETLVPHDSRTADVYDIPDKTVAGLLERLAEAKGDQVTVILDCCHSGSGTRGPEAASPRRVRRVPADLRVPPADLDADIRSKTTSATRSVGIGGGGTQLPYVLLAGCLDREESNEHYGNFGDTAGAWHGALTFFLLQSLRMLPEGATYRELHERVAPLVNVAYPKQTPQCEGDRDRRIFDGVRVERDPFVTVLRVAPDQRAVTLGAGVVHGLHPGTQLALYPAEVRTRAEIPAKPIATVEVVSATATVAEASVQGQPSAEIPSHARAVITVQADGGLRKSVRLEAGDDAAVGDVLAKVRSGLLATAGGNPSPYLRIEDDPDVPVDFVVKADDGHLGVFSDTDTPLIEPLSIAAGGASDDLPSKVIRAMESIARFHTVQNLSNDSGSSLNGKVRLGRPGEL